jgi:hypothetical protein
VRREKRVPGPPATVVPNALQGAVGPAIVEACVASPTQYGRFVDAPPPAKPWSHMTWSQNIHLLRSYGNEAYKLTNLQTDLPKSFSAKQSVLRISLGKRMLR